MALTIKIKRMEIKREGKLNWVFCYPLDFRPPNLEFPESSMQESNSC